MKRFVVLYFHFKHSEIHVINIGILAMANTC